MINKNELRVGNHIWGVSDRIEQVNEILSVYVETSFRGGLLHYSSYEDISPIELTSDILLKCGFRRFVNDFSKSGLIVHTRKAGFFLKKSVPQIKYLHQLQNLYFALTGTELTFNQQ